MNKKIDLEKMINESRNQILKYLTSTSQINIIEKFKEFDEKKYSLTDEEFRQVIKEKIKKPFKYNIDFETNEILKMGQAEKRKENYERAMSIYNFILKNDGPSGIVFIAMAKTRACQGYYEEAIDLFEIANKSCKYSLRCDDENCLYHSQTLKDRENLTEKEFEGYLKSISGNINFKISKEHKGKII